MSAASRGADPAPRRRGDERRAGRSAGRSDASGCLLLRAWSRFWRGRADPRWIALFRVGTAVVALAQVWATWPILQMLYGPHGLVQWVVIESAEETWLPSIGKVALVLERIGIGFERSVELVFAAYVVALVFLLVGLRTRVAAVLAWALHALTVNSGYISLYGVDTMLHICLFYLMWMPAGAAWSLDALRRARRRGARSDADRAPAAPESATASERPAAASAHLSLRVLQLHLCIIYANTGLAKALGGQWWSGEALWRALMQPQFALFDMAWIASVPLLATVGGWGVVVVELGYAALIWPARTRRAWLALTIALHVGIAITMGLVLFSAMMIVMNLAAFGARVPASRGLPGSVAAGQRPGEGAHSPRGGTGASAPVA
ncbi:MAG TPA: HTTM domain-containing protein [Phycisphaerales bacterium]|nr:HTTM domain-containing protein [Phycisphaerales bacterium]HMP37696.1 HTTM domain-containing protein [Phycisphaerales bacterium]